MQHNSDNLSGQMNRRRFLATTAALTVPLIAGCSGSDESDSAGSSENSGGDGSNDSGNSVDASNESGNESGDEEPESQDEQEQEQSVEDVENRGAAEDVLTFNDLEITEFEDSINEREYGDAQLVVEGIVKNHSEDKYDSVTVEIRTYDSDGNQLNNHLDHVQNLQGGGTWKFEIVALATPAEEISEYDIAVWGYQW